MSHDTILPPASGYFARQDTRTPVRVGVIALLVNMALNVVFVVPWVRYGLPGPHAGLAIATSISAFLNAALLFRGLRRAGVLKPVTGWPRFLLRIIVACGVMTVLIKYTLPPLPVWLEADTLTRCLWLTGIIVMGSAVYAGALLAMGLRPAELRIKSSTLSL